ncbi:MAG: DUF58 domain-containing protein [Actinomycetota bacterium]
MPTTRGWTLIGAGAIVLSAGRLFGAQPLEQLGFALIALVAIAAAVVNLGTHDLSVARRIVPERAHAGQPVTVTLEVRNEGRGAAPLVLIEDRFPQGLLGTARFAIQGLEPSGERAARFVIRARRRGRYEIGPLNLSFVDPFSLARVRTQISGVTGFLIHPRVENLTAPRDIGERRSMSSAALRQPTTARGEDFYTLREYVEGDDLRKIHWPSTAKRSRYMIRQEETPWHNRATIVLDDGPMPYEGVHDGSSFERAVEAAASFADHFHRSGYSYRLLGAHSPGVPAGRGSEHFVRCLDALAVLDLASSNRDDALLARLSGIESSGGEAALVVVGGSLSADIALALTRCRRSFRQVTAISFPAHRFSVQPTKARWEGERQIAEAGRLLQAAGIRVVAMGPDDWLAPRWGALGARVSRARSEGGDRWALKPEPV